MDESYLPASPPARLTAYEFHVVRSREFCFMALQIPSRLHLAVVGSSLAQSLVSIPPGQGAQRWQRAERHRHLFSLGQLIRLHRDDVSFNTTCMAHGL